MELNDYIQVLTNLSIIIAIIFSIILIFDELYNIGIFTFKYTYLYNYGTFLAKFNNIQTIEFETNRFNLYNNIHSFYKDIFNKSWFNYLFIIVISLLTIFISIAYGMYFRDMFITNQPNLCTYLPPDNTISYIKQFIKCIFGNLHEVIPNCTYNYFIVFIILIFIPISYIIKLVLSIDFTPNSNIMIFSFIYAILSFSLLFKSVYDIYIDNENYNDITSKITTIAIYLICTIIFISSGYIYKYFFDKYTNFNLNTTNDKTTFYDIYKQTIPIKPIKPISPVYNKENLLSTFTYNSKINTSEYETKKKIMDDYYLAVKKFDIEMKSYTRKLNIYNNSTNAKLTDTTSFFGITLNITGLNDKMHLFIIVLLIIIYAIYFYYKNNIYSDNIIYFCIVYLISILVIITIINAILYYNTYINKYIVYEPLAHYKNDMITANTCLNKSINTNDPSASVFYKTLTNSLITNTDESTITIKSAKDIINDIYQLVDIKNFTDNPFDSINTSILTISNDNTDANNIINDINYKLYINATTVPISADVGSPPNTFLKTIAIDAFRNAITTTAPSGFTEAIGIDLVNAVVATATATKEVTSSAITTVPAITAIASTNAATAVIAAVNLNRTLSDDKQYLTENRKNVYTEFISLKCKTYYISSKEAYGYDITISYVYKEGYSISQQYDLTNYYKYVYYKLYQYKSLVDTLIFSTKFSSSYDLLNNEILKLNKILDNLTKYINNEVSKGIDTILKKQISANTAKIYTSSFTDVDVNKLIKQINLTINKYLLDIDNKPILDGELLYYSNYAYLSSTIKAACILFNSKLDLQAISNITTDDVADSDIILIQPSSDMIYKYMKYVNTHADSGMCNINLLHETKLDFSNAVYLHIGATVSAVPTYIKYNIIWKSNKNISRATINDSNSFDVNNTTITLPSVPGYDVNMHYELPISIVINRIPQKCIIKIITNTVFILKIIDSTDIAVSYEKIFVNGMKLTKNVIDKYYYYKYTQESKTEIPYIYNVVSNITTIDTLNKIILAVLYNNLINITSKYNLLNTQKTMGGSHLRNSIAYPTIATYLESSAVTIFPKPFATIYSTKFSGIININSDLNYNETSNNIATFNFAASGNMTAFVVILYNIYMSNISYIPKIIEYIVYNLNNADLQKVIDNSYSFFQVNEDITDNLFSLSSIIDKTNGNGDKDIIRLYEANINTISLIFTLYNNLFTFIRKQISIINTNLCIQDTNLITIETKLYNYITATFTNSFIDAKDSHSFTLKKAITDASIQRYYNNINKHITYFFNIVLFLLKHMNISSSIELESITDNYKFYNINETIIKNPIIQKQLTINDNYYSKYNNLTMKQLSYFKLNTDNVCYNFPILMVIFLIIGGETLFIKS
jgi:hypothetical protein